MKNIPGYIKRNHIKCLSDVRTSTILKYLTVKVSIQIYQATTMSTTSNLSLSNKFSLKQENIWNNYLFNKTKEEICIQTVTLSL